MDLQFQYGMIKKKKIIITKQNKNETKQEKINKEFHLIFVSFRITNLIFLPLFPSDPVDKHNQPKRLNVVF